MDFFKQVFGPKKESEVLQRKVRYLFGDLRIQGWGSAGAEVEDNTSTPGLEFWGQIGNYRRAVLIIFTFFLRNLNITFSWGQSLKCIHYFGCLLVFSHQSR